MAITRIDLANLAQYTSSLNSAGEFVVSARSGGNDVGQALPVPGLPFIVFFDPTNLNFYLIPLQEYQPTWDFVEVVTTL